MHEASQRHLTGSVDFYLVYNITLRCGKTGDSCGCCGGSEAAAAVVVVVVV